MGRFVGCRSDSPAEVWLVWCAPHTAQGGNRILWSTCVGSALSSQRCSREESEPWHKGSEGVTESLAAQGPFSCSPTPWGASKALSLPFELLVQTSLSPQRETQSKTLVVHPIATEPGCNKLVPGWLRGSR